MSAPNRWPPRVPPPWSACSRSSDGWAWVCCWTGSPVASSAPVPIWFRSAGAALLLVDGTDPVSQTIAAALFGLTLGAEVDVIAYLAARYFGLRNFGGLFGGLVAALSLGTAFGPLAAGLSFDRFGGYSEFLVLTMVLMAISSAALASLRPAPVWRRSRRQAVCVGTSDPADVDDAGVELRLRRTGDGRGEFVGRTVAARDGAVPAPGRAVEG